MDFTSVIVVLFTYFIRPQDWVTGLTGVNIVTPIMAVALLAMVTRKRGFTAGSLLQTPHDWAILAYGIYITVTAEDSYGTAKGVFILLAFYFVTAQALVTPRKLEKFMRCWFWALMIVAAMAVASEYGFDPTGAYEITHAVPDVPRLVLNTYLFNNPNALGHTIILTLPIAYFALFWRRPGGKMFLALLMVALSTYCVYLTQSKGAYIAGFVVISAALLLGRHRIFQVAILVLAATVGWGALTQLPRMEQLASARQDEAILGRLLAWEMARTVTRDFSTGVGWQQFQAEIEWEGELFPKATHGTYVKIGADLGRYGLFFFMGVLYCCLRSLLTSRCQNEFDERSRRILIILVLGYMVSGWMIDRPYHLEFFLMAGAASALHRRQGIDLEMYAPIDRPPADELVLEEETADRSPGQDRPILRPEEVDTSAVVEEAIEEELARSRFWARINPFDLAATAGLVWCVFWFWDYILINL